MCFSRKHREGFFRTIVSTLTLGYCCEQNMVRKCSGRALKSETEGGTPPPMTDAKASIHFLISAVQATGQGSMHRLRSDSEWEIKIYMNSSFGIF